MYSKNMQFIKNTLTILLFVFSLATSAQNNNGKKTTYLYQGRIEKLPNDKAILISSGASVSFSFKGKSCKVALQVKDTYNKHGYVSVELDGKYIGRLRIDSDLKFYPINATTNKTHTVTIYKATEAANGGILFDKAKATTLLQIQQKNKKKIEFIGNSITCGMGADTKEIPCGTGEWFDQHNAYLAYGPQVSRQLDLDFQLSSVSGIGMYRNWNDEHQEEAIMPDVYENLYLNKDTSKPYDFSFKPDIISIALGTNDFSDGDGKKKRLPFNPEKFVSNYVAFLKMLYKHNPKAQVVLVNSPMVNGDKDIIFTNCLDTIKQAFQDDKTIKPIQIFKFESVTPHGCTSHPDADDHKLMADQYVPFLKKLL